MHVLYEKEVRDLAEEVAQDLGLSQGDISAVVRLKGRLDCCAVLLLHVPERREISGAVLLIWKNCDGELKYKRLTKFQSPHSVFHIEEVSRVGNDVLVRIGCGFKSFSSFPISVFELDLAN